MKEKISSHPYPTRVSQKPHCGSPNVINQRDQVSSYGHQNNGVYKTTVYGSTEFCLIRETQTGSYLWNDPPTRAFRVKYNKQQCVCMSCLESNGLK